MKLPACFVCLALVLPALSDVALLETTVAIDGVVRPLRVLAGQTPADAATQFAVEHGLGTRVRAFLLQCEERQRRSGYAALFETLSEQIQADLVEHVYARSLSSVTYFRARSVEFRLDVFKVRARVVRSRARRRPTPCQTSSCAR